MKEIHRITTASGKKSNFIEQRRVVDERERFTFESAESFPESLWRPKYSGFLHLMLYVAEIEINDLRHHQTHRGVLALGGEASMYARDKNMTVRSWAASMMTREVIERFIEGQTINNTNDEAWVESLSLESRKSIQQHGLQVR